jgi:hypothetical protein
MTAHLHLVSRLRMSGAEYLLPPYAFMVWNIRDNLTFLYVTTKNLYSDYSAFAQSFPIKGDGIAPRSVADLHGFPIEHVLHRVQSRTHQRLFRLFGLFTP